MKVKIINDLASEKHDEENNRKIMPYALGGVFFKAGTYILNLGIVSFLEIISMNLLCYVYCYFLEKKAYEENKPLGIEPSLIEQNQYIILTIANVLGNLIFSAYVQAFSMLYPAMPVYL